MTLPPRAAIIRIFIFLVIVCAASFGWETHKTAGLKPINGVVNGYAYKGYTIKYRANGQPHQFATRIGTLDAMTGLGDLPVGAKVPLLVNTGNPYEATLNTLNARYGLTLTLLALFILFAIALVLPVLHRLGSRAKKSG